MELSKQKLNHIKRLFNLANDNYPEETEAYIQLKMALVRNAPVIIRDLEKLADLENNLEKAIEKIK